MTTLATALLDLAHILQDVVEGAATGGSVTTLIDTAIPREIPADDYFNNGTIWFLSTVGITGKTAKITDWANGTKTFTFATQAAAPVAGTLYAACTDDYPKDVMIHAINRALLDIGSIPAVDVTVTTVANQEAYTLPVGVANVVRVEVAQTTAAPYLYRKHYGWRVLGDKLYFATDRAPVETGLIIRLTYAKKPDRLTGDTDAISDLIDRTRLSWKAAVVALRWRVARTGRDRPELIDLLNEALKNEQTFDAQYPIPDIRRDPRLAGWGEEP